jgi:hypothetical protein
MLKHIAWPPGIRVRCPANRWSVVAAHDCRQVAHLCDAAALDISPITRVAGVRIGRYLLGMPCHVMSCQCYAMPCHAMPCGKGTRSVDMVCMDNEQKTKGTYSGAGEISSVPARACVLAGLRLGNEWAEGSPMRLRLRRQPYFKACSRYTDTPVAHAQEKLRTRYSSDHRRALISFVRPDS